MSEYEISKMCIVGSVVVIVLTLVFGLMLHDSEMLGVTLLGVGLFIVSVVNFRGM